MTNDYTWNTLMASKNFRNLILIILLLPGLSFSQNCNTNLNVKKDRSFSSIHSINGNKTIFNMVLENTSSKSQTYQIVSKQLSKDCSNTTLKRKQNQKNVLLDVNIPKELNSKLLYPGEVYEFKIIVSAPKETETGKWGCIEILATTKNCASASSQVLSVYVSSGEEND